MVIGRSCTELEAEGRNRLIHPVHRNAVLRLSSLLDQLLKLKSKKARLELLKSDRKIVLSIVKHAIMKRGNDTALRIWDVHDDIEDVWKELERK